MNSTITVLMLWKGSLFGTCMGIGAERLLDGFSLIFVDTRCANQKKINLQKLLQPQVGGVMLSPTFVR